MTNYSLVVRNVKNLEDFESLDAALEEFDLYRYVFDTGAYYHKEKEAIFSCWEAQEWQKYDGQMIVLSEKFPKMTFELTCQCGDSFWRVYYKDGAKEQCSGDVVFEKPRKIAWDALLAF